MNKITLGYIPENWKAEDNENYPGHITIGDDSSGTISNFITYENIYDDNDDIEIYIFDDFSLSLDSDNFCNAFKKIANKYFSEIQEHNKNLNVAAALQVGWYILNDDCVEDEILKNYDFSKITQIDADCGEFENSDGKYNGCMFLRLTNEEQIENDEDGDVFILKPLKN